MKRVGVFLMVACATAPLMAQGLPPVPNFSNMPRFERSLWGTTIPVALGGTIAVTSPRDRVYGGVIALLGVTLGPSLGYVGEHGSEERRGWLGVFARSAAVFVPDAYCNANCPRNGLIIAGEAAAVISAVADIVHTRHRSPAGPRR